LERIISFSLFGTDPIYLHGAIENARSCPVVFPGWTCRFYASNEIPAVVISDLRRHGAQVVLNRRTSPYDGLFWRFLPAAEQALDAMIVRDVDSRPTARDRATVEDWLRTGRGFHVIRDHPNHVGRIMAGMWGCRGGVLADIKDLIHTWTYRHYGDSYGSMRERNCDQVFLYEMVYPRVRDNGVIHSEFVRFDDEEVKPIPCPRHGLEFVGQVVFADGSTRQDHLDELARALTGS
jgi:hypothetical protein